METRVLTPDEGATATDLRDWLMELRDLQKKALSRRDAEKAQELRFEIEQVALYLDEVVEVRGQLKRDAPDNPPGV
jgi:hypothetical protein